MAVPAHLLDLTEPSARPAIDVRDAVDDILPAVRAGAVAAERARRLPDGVVDALRSTGVNRLLRVADLEIEDTWHSTGLRATGSHHVTASDLFVDSDRSCLFGGEPWADGALWRVPVITIAKAILGLDVRHPPLVV